MVRAVRVLLVVSVVMTSGVACSRQDSGGGRAPSGSDSPPRAAQASPAAASPQSAQQPAVATPQEQKKPLRFQGAVESVNVADGMITVKNDDVPGWGMPSMTMSYRVSNAPALKSLTAGDRVTATVYKGDFGTLYDVAAAPKAPSTDTSSSEPADALPPLSYVCPTPGEENEINDRPGACEKSAAKLVPIRLVIAYECLKGPAFIQAKPGTCRYDKSQLAPITASMFWACSDEPDATRYLEPGTCADGAERKQRFEKRPHGDHNPRHGGPYVAMSEDLMHHSEGTFVAPGTFRAYFYDEYTRPMRVAGYAARLVPTDKNAREIGQPIPMHAVPSLGPNVMEARVPGAAEPTSALPQQFKMHVTVARAAKDWTSDWSFIHYSKEPGNGVASTTLASAGTRATPTTTARAPLGGATTSGPASPGSGGSTTVPAAAPPAAPPITTASTGTAAAPASGLSGATASSNATSGSGSTMAGGAELGAYAPVQPEPAPPTASGILTELKTHTDAVAQLLQEGNLAGMWQDALRAKDLVVALEEKHEGEVQEASRPELTSAVKELTRSAWEIDAAGDLGQAEKITQLQQVFENAAARIQKVYGTAHP